MKINQKNTFFIVFFSFVLICIILRRIIYKNEGIILKENHQITFGNITYFGSSAGGAAAAPEYTFRSNGKKYDVTFYSSTFCKRFSTKDEYNIQRTKFPVIYNPDNPEISRILLRKKDYRKYNVPIPDTLKHIIDKYFECD